MSHDANILPVIICGGAGSRLWPLSGRSEPKQFAALIGKTSLFQDTLARFSGDSYLPPAIICNSDHKDMIEAQAREIGVILGAVVLEPVGRNTAACGVVSAMLGTHNSAAKTVLMAPADHHMTRPEGFADAVRTARPSAESGNLVTFGITPTSPHIGYGYIESGEAVGAGQAVVKFHEKPTLDRAQAYVDSGGFFWNAGIFMFSPTALLDEFSTHAPDVLATVKFAAGAVHNDASIVLDSKRFEAVPDISFDYAIAERTDQAVVVEVDMGWSDIGSYSALFALREALGRPAVPDTAIVVSGEGVHVDSDVNDLIVTVVGLDNVGVIVRAGCLLVVNLAQDQAVKAVVQALPSEKR